MKLDNWMDTFDKYAEEAYQDFIDDKHSRILKYGTVIYDNETTEGPNHYRLRTINVDDIIYLDWMRNGVVVFCEPITDKRDYDKRIEMSDGI